MANTNHSMTMMDTVTDPDALRDLLRDVIDPEVGMNIVDLGLIYRIAMEGETLVVEMTMTSPACPMGEMIVAEVESVLGKHLPASMRADVRLVWSPPWTPAMMSAVAKDRFGW